jgi:SAM-dependent methyltransferase
MSSFSKVPAPIKDILRPLKYFVLDNVDVLTGRRSPLTPPNRLVALVGGGDFAKIGNDMVQSFIKFQGLQPWHRVLDIGSGIGRVAVPLTRFLNERGSYEGMDVWEIGVKWCTRNIHKRYKNFRFHCIDIYNSFYNPTGERLSRNYTFPFGNDEFDFIVLTSVFTHMLEEDVERYITERAAGPALPRG